MKYINVIPTISNHSAGVGKFVKIFHQALLDNGIIAHIYSQDARDLQVVMEVDVFKFMPQLGRLQFSLELFRAVRQEIKLHEGTIFHIHGLWMWVNIFPFFIKDIKYVYSPHGSISPKTVESWSLLKRFFFYAIQRHVKNSAFFVHATSELEKKWLIDVGVKDSSVKVIPSCDEIPEDYAFSCSPIKSKKKSFIFVGRLAKIKNLEILIDSFISLQHEHCDATLEIIGDNSTPYAKSLILRASGCKNITFLGELPQKEVLLRLRNTSHFVLPSFTENFSYSALEACYSGCSLVISENTPWPELTPTFVAAVFSPDDPKSVRLALKKCLVDDTPTLDKQNLCQFKTIEFVKKLTDFCSNEK